MKLYLKTILISSPTSFFYGLRFYVSPSNFLLCKVMAAQTDTKDRAEPLFDTNFSGSLPQIKDLGFPENFLPNSLAYCP